MNRHVYVAYCKISTNHNPFIHTCLNCHWILFCKTFSHIWIKCIFARMYPRMHLSVYPPFYTRFDKVRASKTPILSFHLHLGQETSPNTRNGKILQIIVCNDLSKCLHVSCELLYLLSSNVTNAGAMVVPTWKGAHTLRRVFTEFA